MKQKNKEDRVKRWDSDHVWSCVNCGDWFAEKLERRVKGVNFDYGGICDKCYGPKTGKPRPQGW